MIYYYDIDIYIYIIMINTEYLLTYRVVWSNKWGEWAVEVSWRIDTSRTSAQVFLIMIMNYISSTAGENFKTQGPVKVDKWW